MAVEQKNYALFTYVDNTGQSWNKRGEKDSVRNAVDGSAAPGAHPGWGRSTRRHQARAIVYRDLTTFRTKKVTMYTAAAAAAITLGTSTLTFFIEGEATGVVYTASALIEEKLQGATATTAGLPEHA